MILNSSGSSRDRCGRHVKTPSRAVLSGGAVDALGTGVQPVEWADADPGLRGLCVVAVTNKFTRTIEILWRKRDSMVAL